jgi:HSP20 family protein
MHIVRWDPLGQLRFFEREPIIERACAPAVDIEETDAELKVHAELPGIKPDDIAIELDGDVLTIRGERKEEKEENHRNFVRVERAYGVFHRSFHLGTPVKREEITATYHDGVVELILPKSGGAKPKQIVINVEDGPAA